MSESEINSTPQEVIKKPEVVTGEWVKLGQEMIGYLNKQYHYPDQEFMTDAIRFSNTNVAKDMKTLLSSMILMVGIKKGEVYGGCVNEHDTDGDSYICFCYNNQKQNSQKNFLDTIGIAIKEISPILESIGSKVMFPKTR